MPQITRSQMAIIMPSKVVVRIKYYVKLLGQRLVYNECLKKILKFENKHNIELGVSIQKNVGISTGLHVDWKDRVKPREASINLSKKNTGEDICLSS